MPTLTIDGRRVTAPDGTTILQAAEQLGIRIPTLCHVRELRPLESCFVCVVHVALHKRLVPACSMPVAEGMDVTTDSAEIREARRSAIELLLSEHLGECEAPCELACPARWNITDCMAAARAGDIATAAAIARDGLALPGVLGALCDAPCQKACRRNDRDESVAIREVHEFLASLRETAIGLAGGRDICRRFGCRHETPCGFVKDGSSDVSPPAVAVIGAGPAGLAAAHRLAGAGYSVTVFERTGSPGGSLGKAIPIESPDATEDDSAPLPADVLQRDIDAIVERAVVFESGVDAGGALSAEELRGRFGALVIACGAECADEIAKRFGLATTDGRIAVETGSRATSSEGVFAVGACAGVDGRLVRVVADGLAVAESVGQFLRGERITGPARRFVTRYGPLTDRERDALWALAENPSRRATSPVDDVHAVGVEAQRCLLCGCRENDHCALRKLAAEFRARPVHHVGERRPLLRDASHEEIVHELHKCILCGACVELARRRAEPMGLDFVGRGFAARVTGPYEAPLAQALGDGANTYADICPTSAFHRKGRTETR